MRMQAEDYVELTLRTNLANDTIGLTLDEKTGALFRVGGRYELVVRKAS